MKIELESTDDFVVVNGVNCRVWHGRTEGGVPFAFVCAGIAVQEGYDAREFGAALVAMGKLEATDETHTVFELKPDPETN